MAFRVFEILPLMKTLNHKSKMVKNPSQTKDFETLNLDTKVFKQCALICNDNSCLFFFHKKSQVQKYSGIPGL